MSKQKLSVLVLGYDLEREEELGKRTKTRVKRAVKFIEQHPEAVLYAAATKPSNFPRMKKSMATMMAAYARNLLGKSNKCVAQHSDAECNTEGEISIFLPHTRGPYVVVSSWWHLPRVFLIIWKLYGLRSARNVTYVASWNEPLTPKMFVLEIGKCFYLFFPKSLKVWTQRVYRSLFGSPSW